MIKRKLTLIMENKPGALVRVVGLFHQRGYNIESLHVDPIDDFTPYKFIEEQLETKFKENEISRLTVWGCINKRAIEIKQKCINHY